MAGALYRPDRRRCETATLVDGASHGVVGMFRASLAGLMLSLCASTALATPAFVFNTPYIYETSSNAAPAPGTLTPPPGAGLASAGGLCSPGTDTGCPGMPNANLTSQLGPLSSGQPRRIDFTTPNLPLVSAYLLHISVGDDSNSGVHATGFPGATLGDVFEVVLDGGSIGVTSTTGLDANNPLNNFSAGEFDILVGAGAHTLGITDLLQPYATNPNGLTDTLPNVLCNCTSPLSGGLAAPGTFASNIVDIEISATPVPEPASIALLGGGVLVLGAIRGRRQSCDTAQATPCA